MWITQKKSEAYTILGTMAKNEITFYNENQTFVSAFINPSPLATTGFEHLFYANGSFSAATVAKVQGGAGSKMDVDIPLCDCFFTAETDCPMSGWPLLGMPVPEGSRTSFRYAAVAGLGGAATRVDSANPLSQSGFGQWDSPPFFIPEGDADMQKSNCGVVSTGTDPFFITPGLLGVNPINELQWVVLNAQAALRNDDVCTYVFMVLDDGGTSIKTAHIATGVYEIKNTFY